MPYLEQIAPFGFWMRQSNFNTLFMRKGTTIRTSLVYVLVSDFSIIVRSATVLAGYSCKAMRKNIMFPVHLALLHLGTTTFIHLWYSCLIALLRCFHVIFFKIHDFLQFLALMFALGLLKPKVGVRCRSLGPQPSKGLSHWFNCLLHFSFFSLPHSGHQHYPTV